MKASSLTEEVLFILFPEHSNFNSYFYWIPAIQVALRKSCRYDKSSTFEGNSKLWTSHLFQILNLNKKNVIISKYLTILWHHIWIIMIALTWTSTEKTWHVDTKGSKLSNLHTENVMATVICEKQTLSKIHPNSWYPCRSQTLAISNITEEIYCRCRYIIKFAKMEFNCLYQSLPFSSRNLLSPLRQQIHCRVGWTRLLGMALYQPLTLTWHRKQHGLSEKLPQKKSSQKYTYMLPSLWHRKNLN